MSCERKNQEQTPTKKPKTSEEQQLKAHNSPTKKALLKKQTSYYMLLEEVEKIDKEHNLSTEGLKKIILKELTDAEAKGHIIEPTPEMFEASIKGYPSWMNDSQIICDKYNLQKIGDFREHISDVLKHLFENTATDDDVKSADEAYQKLLEHKECKNFEQERLQKHLEGKIKEIRRMQYGEHVREINRERSLSKGSKGSKGSKRGTSGSVKRFHTNPDRFDSGMKNRYDRRSVDTLNNKLVVLNKKEKDLFKDFVDFGDKGDKQANYNHLLDKLIDRDINYDTQENPERLHEVNNEKTAEDSERIAVHFQKDKKHADAKKAVHEKLEKEKEQNMIFLQERHLNEKKELEKKYQSEKDKQSQENKDLKEKLKQEKSNQNKYMMELNQQSEKQQKEKEASERQNQEKKILQETQTNERKINEKQQAESKRFQEKLLASENFRKLSHGSDKQIQSELPISLKKNIPPKTPSVKTNASSIKTPRGQKQLVPIDQMEVTIKKPNLEQKELKSPQKHALQSLIKPKELQSPFKYIGTYTAKVILEPEMQSPTKPVLPEKTLAIDQIEDIFNLEKILLDKGGLFGIKLKLPIKSKSTLGMIYTPGVGKICKELQSDPQKAYSMTNKANSMFVTTDSTGFEEYDISNWNNDLAIPYLEAKTLFYKCTCNIDCYPLVLDHSKTKSAQDIWDIQDNMTLSYTACELYKLSEARQEQFKKLLEKNPIDLVIIMDEHREYIQEQLNSNKFVIEDISENFVISGIMRALMDARHFGLVSMRLIKNVLENVNDKYKDVHSCGEHLYLDYLLTIHQATLDFCKEKFCSTLPTESFQVKLQNYMIFGHQPEGVQKPYLYHDHSNDKNSVYLHKLYQGVIETKPRINMLEPMHLDKLLSESNLKKIYNIIKEDPSKAEYMTCKKNFCAIITNGTAVLGFGNIGGLAGMPVMEGKSVLFKEFGNSDVMPICFKELDKVKVSKMVERISPIFGAINLEDIKAPDCFYIERYLNKHASCPVFHDDQHGTAVVVLAALINSLKILKKKASDIKIIINGGGAAGISICELQLNNGTKNIIVCDTKGAIYEGRPVNMNDQKIEMAKMTNRKKIKGELKDVIVDADVFIGVSAAGVLKKSWVGLMKKKPVVMALANPVPEIMPNEAKAAGAFIVATGRSDFPNQVNNSQAFPGIFRAIQNVRVTHVSIEMKVCAAKAIAGMVTKDELNVDKIMPDPLDHDVPVNVATAVEKCAIDQGLIQKDISK